MRMILVLKDRILLFTKILLKMSSLKIQKGFILEKVQSSFDKIQLQNI